MLPNGTYGHADSERSLENPGADTVIPIFYIEKQINKKKSDLAGHTVWDEYEAARFIIPGDNTFEHRERLNEEHKRRWPTRYQQFKDGLDQSNGQPLDTWYKMANHPGLLEEMRGMRIRSVEDLAMLNDDVAMRTSWGMEWRKLARAEVESRKAKEAMTEANAELQAKLDTETAAREALEKRLADMEAMLTVGPNGPALKRKAG